MAHFVDRLFLAVGVGVVLCGFWLLAVELGYVGGLR